MKATFVFVDLAGFTALTEAHGDVAAVELVDRFAALIDAALGGEGRRVKMIGDAAFVVVADPAAAVGFLARLFERAEHEPEFPVLRAGAHHGDAVEHGDDVYGAAVNVAARIAARARGSEVLATTEVADAARRRGIAVGSAGRVALKNVRVPVDLYRLDLQAADSAPAIDPVCRMRVERETAAGRLRHEGVDYWFCSLACAHSFAESPEAYVADT